MVVTLLPVTLGASKTTVSPLPTRMFSILVSMRLMSLPLATL